jgi:hypothetical protein
VVWSVLARAADRSVAGLLRGWKLSLTLRFNEVGSWTLEIPRDLCPTGWPAPGAGILALSDGTVRASGVLDDESYDWSADPSSVAVGPGMWSLTGDTDLGRIAYRIVYPTPSAAWSAQNVTASYTASGAAATLMQNLVNVQAGPGALAARRTGIVLGAATAAGTSTQISERFTPLLDALRTVALAGGGLGFDVVADAAGNLPFTVYQPVDRSATARFAVELGNVTDLHASRTAPTGTVALVAGSGVGTARQTLEQADPLADAAWGRREVFVDQRQTSDTAEYAKAATEALAAAAQQVTAYAPIVDTAATRWGRDYGLGDLVSVVTPFGVVTDVVRAVQVDVTEDGDAVVSSTVGTDQATSDDRTARFVAQLTRRISGLERAQ